MHPWYKVNDFPIKKKLWHFHLLTSLISGISAAVMLILIVWNIEYRDAEHEAGIKAAIIAENALPALRFRDVKTAEEVLAGLGRDTEILSARIVEPNGQTFAAFVPRHADAARGSTREGMIQIRVSAPMASGKERVATLEMVSDGNAVIQQIMVYVGAVFLSAVLALLIGSLIAVRLQLAITQPLSALVALMKDVSAGGDLSQRATVVSHDELGELGESFNRMIGQIEHRNTALGEELAERVRAEKRLEHLALHDQVTGLPNRHYFRKRTAELMNSQASGGGSRALLFIDLDNFKYINDTFGHDCGDQLLIVMAERLSAAVRTHDMVVRFGGDEFVVVLDRIHDVDQALQRAHRLLDVVTQPFKLTDREFFVTCSIGVAITPAHGVSFDVLLQKADAAMYVAKNAGKNGVRLWEPLMSNESSTRFELESDLHLALENGEIEMHYQPIVSLATGRLEGMEALMRWRHPSRGLVPPAVFIPIAEDSGLILGLGEWAMRTAFQQTAAWNQQFTPLFIAVNVSGRQFREPAFAAKSERIANACGLARHLCELEVTESIVMSHSGEAASVLNELSGYGFSLSLDDFGTGYSSLSYLKRFSLDKLKIDRSFVMDLPDDVENIAITKAIIGLAKTLSMRTVAEGIETADQAATLRTLECQYGQGYYFSHPLTVEQMTAFIHYHQPANLLAA